MNEPVAARIEIFAPFGAALELTKRILFQPFDFTKWLVIGFAAFLAKLAGGTHFNYSRKMNLGDMKWRVTSHSALQSATDSGLPAWAWPLIIIAVVLVIALVIACLWVGSRGKFIFTDCIVHNRGAIVEPWREYRHEGNSYFLFLLGLGVVLLILFCILSLPMWLPIVLHGEAAAHGASFIGAAVLFALLAVVVMVTVALVSSFMVPIMYRRRCRAGEAFRAALGLIMAHLGPVLLFVLFIVVLWVAVGMIACLATCLTCCLAAIPYVGTVILLPLHVFIWSFVLLFVRQFGSDSDAWGNLALPETVAPPPPVQS